MLRNVIILFILTGLTYGSHLNEFMLYLTLAKEDLFLSHSKNNLKIKLNSCVEISKQVYDSVNVKDKIVLEYHSYSKKPKFYYEIKGTVDSVLSGNSLNRLYLVSKNDSLCELFNIDEFYFVAYDDNYIMKIEPWCNCYEKNEKNLFFYDSLKHNIWLNSFYERGKKMNSFLNIDKMDYNNVK